MKKLMIAFAAVAMAACAQAATVTWTASAIKSYTDGTQAASGYYAVLIDSDICDSSDMEAAFGDGTWKTAIANAAIANSATTVSNGSAVKTGAGSYEASTTINAYAVIFDASSMDTATHAYITNEKTASTGSKGQAATIGLGSQAGSADASNWQSIPEPTSGLLLLLGVAGLALKRKRA